MFTPDEFSIGMRVELHPATDRWMRGDRYGEVVKITRRYVYVRLDRSGDHVKCAPHLLLPLVGLAHKPVRSAKRLLRFPRPVAKNVHDIHWSVQ